MLAQAFDVSRIAIMNHLKVLEEASLIVSEKRGRARHLYLNVMPIHAIQERWISHYSADWADRLSFIKTAAEQAAHKHTPKDG